MLFSTASQDRGLCRTALELGRTVTALEPDLANMKKESEYLDTLVAERVKHGVWARIIDGPVKTVGRNILPAKVPSSNIPAATATELDAARATSKDSAADNEALIPERKEANDAADLHGLQIRVRRIFRKQVHLLLLELRANCGVLSYTLERMRYCCTHNKYFPYAVLYCSCLS